MCRASGVHYEAHRPLQHACTHYVAQIRRAYRSLLVAAHPDRGGSEERFRGIKLAYSVLSDSKQVPAVPAVRADLRLDPAHSLRLWRAARSATPTMPQARPPALQRRTSWTRSPEVRSAAHTSLCSLTRSPPPCHESLRWCVVRLI